jgi:threonine/homoserine/homoserine lactone efflux protein
MQSFLPLLLFTLATSVTPGPNNLMLLASGVNFGLVRTLPHILGITTGFGSLLLGIGLGLGALFTAWPTLHLVLKLLGGCYLLYLAWKIAGSRAIGETKVGAKPLSFAQAAAFQWVNPKAWVIALTVTSLFADPERPYVSVLLVALTVIVFNLPAIILWTGFGTALRGFLSRSERLKIFNVIMAFLLVATLIPMLR